MTWTEQLTTACEAVHQWAISKGFWEHETLKHRDPVLGDVEARIPNPSIFEEKLMLIVSEVAEVLEARRDGDSGHEEEECADILIRLMDYCAARGFDLGRAYHIKMLHNADRPRLHGRVR